MVINATTLLTANVTVSTGTDGTQSGMITLAANTPLSWTTSAVLTLQAAGDIALLSDITAPAGGLAGTVLCIVLPPRPKVERRTEAVAPRP